MDETTQKNASLVEQAAAAASMSEQADRLMQEISVFKLGHEAMPVTTIASVARQTAASQPVMGHNPVTHTVAIGLE